MKQGNKYLFKLIFFYYNYIKIITPLMLFVSVNAKEIKNRKLTSEIFEIKIKVNGIGNQEIIYNDFETMPDKIYSSNGDEIIGIGNSINIEENESSIILKWNNFLDDCSFMFYKLENIIEIDLSNFDPSNVSTMKQMFSGCSNLEKINIGNNFNSLIVSDLYQIFFGCSSLKSLDLSKFDTSNVKKMHNMFYDCKSLISLDISNFDTSLVDRMEKMFKNCESILSLDLRNFNTKKINNMNSMFEGCKSLMFLNIENFDTSLVTSMENMFRECKSLLSLNVSNFNTTSLTTMRYMFAYDEKLEFLDLTNFNLSSVTNLEKIFSNCISLTSIDMSSFDTSSVNNFEKMFFNCTSLTFLNLSNLNMSSANDMPFMFQSCSKLEYIKLKSFTEAEDLNTTNMFLDTPDDLIYCIDDISKMPNIVKQLEDKLCTFNDCETNWKENKEKRFEEKKRNIQVYEDKCIYKNIKYISNEFIITDLIPNTTIYSYDIESNVDELMNKYSNLTFIEITQEQINEIREYFNLDKNEKLYFLVIDTASNDSMTATSYYNYKLLLENGTVLDLIDSNIDIEVNIHVPIRDLELAKFENAEYFSNEGYDIYDMNSNFYIDYCLSASLNGNDITINDRKQEIFPNNVTLCKSDCKYQGVNLEDKRVICKCDLIISDEKNNSKVNENNNIILNYFGADDGNFGTYLLDNINYKPFNCGKLLLLPNIIKYNYSFYIIIFILIVIIFITIEFFSYRLLKIRVYLFKESPIEQRLRKSKIKTEKKITLNNRLISSNVSNVKKNNDEPKVNLKNKKKKSIKVLKRNRSVIFNKTKLLTQVCNKRKRSGSTKKIIISNSTNTDKEKHKITLKNMPNLKNPKKEEKEEDKNEPNEMPFSQAMREDKRNIIQTFKSIIFEKIELINIFLGKQKIKELLICEFILSLLINFFFNCLLYSDEIVSHKYHNNGNLDLIVTFSLSILSNIITSIICFFLEYSPLIEDRLEQIVEIKNEYDYLKVLEKFFRNLKIKIIIFFINEITVVIISFYYIVIFTIIYNKSQTSLVINYLWSLLEDLIKSLIITIIIVLTRKIGISCSNKYIYNTSKYINEKF